MIDGLSDAQLRVCQTALNIAALLWGVVGFGFAANCYRDFMRYWRNRRRRGP